MRDMNNRKKYPKQNAPVKDAEPQYEGRKMWRTGDTRVQCYDADCFNYASHEATLRRVPDPFDKSEFVRAPICSKHARKDVAVGQVVSITPYPEYVSFHRERDKWKARRVGGVQGVLV